MDCTLSGLLPAIFTTIIICLLISHYNRPRPTLAATLPWADLRDEYFAKTRASLRHLTNSSQILRDGYEKYGKHNQPFFVSDASFQPQIMLPQSYITWLATRSETILSIWPVRTKRRAMEAMIDSVDHKGTVAFMDKVVSRFLTRNLGTAQGECADEIAKSVDDAMGVETNVWRDVNMVDMFKEVGDRSGVRALFGKTLCRDREFLRVLGRYKTLMGFGIFFNGQLPPGVRQVVALLLAIPFRVCKGRVKKVLVPIVEERMREAMRGTDDVAGEEGGQNLLTQCVRTVLKEKSNVQRSSPDHIADQFLVLSFASLASIALVAGNLFLDILSTPNALERLRSEAANVLKSTEDLANPAALKKLVLMDSAIRESLRRSSIQTRGLLREVVATDGVDLPNGTHVDRGTWVGVPVEAVHMSEEFYEKSDSYDPFRFAKINEGSEAQLEASDVTNEFLAWSHGTHPCPGRWFAIQNLKLMIAYIALNYEVEPIVDRPPSIVVGDANLPNFSFCIRVRRIKRV